MKDIVKMYNEKQFRLSNDGDMYYLTNTMGVEVLKMYMPQFIIQLEENRFAVGSETINFNRKNFSIFNLEPITGKVTKEFGCDYYGKDFDNYAAILRRVKNMFHNNKFFLQYNNRVVIYDVESREKMVLKNVPNGIIIEENEEGISVNTTARSQFDESITDKIEFAVNKEGLPISGFYSNLQDRKIDLYSAEETAETLRKDIEEVTYEDILNTTYCHEILYYLNRLAYSQTRHI